MLSPRLVQSEELEFNIYPPNLLFVYSYDYFLHVGE